MIYDYIFINIDCFPISMTYLKLFYIMIEKKDINSYFEILNGYTL